MSELKEKEESNEVNREVLNACASQAMSRTQRMQGSTNGFTGAHLEQLNKRRSDERALEDAMAKTEGEAWRAAGRARVEEEVGQRVLKGREQGRGVEEQMEAARERQERDKADKEREQEERLR